MAIELKNTLVAGYSVSGTGGSNEKPMESLTLNVTKIVNTTTQYDPQARMVQPDRPQWNLSEE